MMQFTSMTVEWSQRTFIFYLAIVGGCYIISRIIPKKTIRCGKVKLPVGLFIVEIILLVVKCFNTTGRDLRMGYALNYDSAVSMASFRDKTVEPSFRLLMVLFRSITNNYAIFLFFVGILTILPVIYLFHKYRDRIDVPTAILLFTSIYFINGFSAYRQYMAVSLSLFVFDALIEKKIFKALVWIIISSSIHIACIALFIPYFFCCARLLSRKLIAISTMLFFTVFYIGRSSFASLINGYERYAQYKISEQISFGIEQIVYYAPLFFLLYLCRKYRTDKNIFRLTYVYLVTGFLFGMISYIMPIFGRMQSLFIPIIIVVPYFLKKYKDNNDKSKRRLIDIVSVFYCIARFVIWITQYYNLEDLMPYTNVFGIVV